MILLNHKSKRYEGLLFFLILIGTYTGYGQLSNIIPRAEGQRAYIGLSASYGEILDRDAWFYGFSVEYARRLNKQPFGFAGSLMWDSEKDETKHKTLNTFTVAITGSFLFARRFSVGTGIAKGFLNTDNSDATYRFADGDWTTAIFVGYQLPLKKNRSLGFSFSYEYNLSARENSLSIDLALGLPI